MFNILSFFFLRITVCKSVCGKLVPGLIAPNLVYANGAGAISDINLCPVYIFMFLWVFFLLRCLHFLWDYVIDF